MTGQLLRDREVRALLLVQWLPPSFVTGAEALVVPYAVERGFPDGSAGLLLASVPVGMLAGNLAVGRLLRPATRERLVAPILVLFGVPLMALAAPLPLTVVAGLLFVAGAGFSYALGVQRPFLESLGPAVRGQGFAVLTTGLMTLQGVGPLLTGLVAQYVVDQCVDAGRGRSDDTGRGRVVVHAGAPRAAVVAVCCTPLG